MFIPIGAGSVLSALTSGKLIDWNYRRHAKRLGIPVVKNRRQDLRNFPIETARLQVGFPMLFLAGAAVMSYGWAVRAGAPLAAPIVVLFMAGFALTFTFQVLNVLLVDMWPGQAAVATSANNLVRCEIGAVFTGIIGPLTGAVGEGWAYTILAAGLVAVAPVLVVAMRRGIKWREERRVKEEKKKGVKEEKREKKEKEAEDLRAKEEK
jgi:MFS family permease